MTSGQIHVAPHSEGGWSVRRDGDAEPISVHSTVWLAEKAALKHASSMGAPVVVHGGSPTGTHQGDR
jgi:hypothetical protein